MAVVIDHVGRSAGTRLPRIVDIVHGCLQGYHIGNLNVLPAIFSGDAYACGFSACVSNVDGTCFGGREFDAAIDLRQHPCPSKRGRSGMQSQAQRQAMISNVRLTGKDGNCLQVLRGCRQG